MSDCTGKRAGDVCDGGTCVAPDGCSAGACLECVVVVPAPDAGNASVGGGGCNVAGVAIAIAIALVLRR